jgi:hypothetical protein
MSGTLKEVKGKVSTEEGATATADEYATASLAEVFNET